MLQNPICPEVELIHPFCKGSVEKQQQLALKMPCFLTKNVRNQKKHKIIA